MIVLGKLAKPLVRKAPAGAFRHIQNYFQERRKKMTKPFRSYDELITFLQTEKNLVINDTSYAKSILTKTSYFSLISGYKDSFKNPTTGKYRVWVNVISPTPEIRVRFLLLCTV